MQLRSGRDGFRQLLSVWSVWHGFNSMTFQIEHFSGQQPEHRGREQSQPLPLPESNWLTAVSNPCGPTHSKPSMMSTWEYSGMDGYLVSFQSSSEHIYPLVCQGDIL